MVTLTASVVIPDDRRITLTLPPETPAGSAEISIVVSPHLESDNSGNDSKFHREWTAYHEQLPDLLKKHQGQYVAIHDGQVVEIGPDRIAVGRNAHRRFGNVPILVRLVAEHQPVVNIPSLFRPRKIG